MRSFQPPGEHSDSNNTQHRSKMSFDSLPVEILQKVFDYLPPDEQLEKTLVNRRWNRLTLREYYLCLTRGRFLISRKFLEQTKRGYCCFFVEFSKPYGVYQPLIQICSEKFFLRKLILTGIRNYALLLLTHRYRDWLRNVVSLTVNYRCDDEVFVGDGERHDDFLRLKVLSWTYNTLNAEEDVIDIGTFLLHTPALEEAHVEWSESTNQLPLVLKDTANLKSLRISVPMMIPAVCPNGLPALECLKIYNSADPFQWDLKQFDFPRLITLELHGCTISDETIAVMNHFSKLKTLIIQDSGDEINLHHIANAIPHLRQLRLFDVQVTFNPATLNFPHLEILDLNDIVPCGPVGYYPLEIDAPNLMTLKGAAHNIIGLNMIHPITRTLILGSLYLNMSQPRQYESVMILHLDISCATGQPRVTECIHQFPNLSNLTLILHDKQDRVSLSGHLLAVSFRLSYLHLQNFDLDYDFLVGISNLPFLTLVLQDGTLDVTQDDRPLFIREVYLKNVKLPSDVSSFPVRDIQTKIIDAQPEGNIFSTLEWNERKIKSAEDYVTYLAWF